MSYDFGGSIYLFVPPLEEDDVHFEFFVINMLSIDDVFAYSIGRRRLIYLTASLWNLGI